MFSFCVDCVRAVYSTGPSDGNSIGCFVFFQRSWSGVPTTSLRQGKAPRLYYVSMIKPNGSTYTD